MLKTFAEDIQARYTLPSYIFGVICAFKTAESGTKTLVHIYRSFDALTSNKTETETALHDLQISLFKTLIFGACASNYFKGAAIAGGTSLILYAATPFGRTSKSQTIRILRLALEILIKYKCSHN